MLDLWIVRGVFLAVFSLLSYHVQPFGLESIPAAGFGFVSGAAIIVFEIRLRRASLKRLIGAAIGSILGILGAFLMSLVLGSSLESDSVAFFQLGVMLLMTYVGLVVGAAKGDLLNLGALGGCSAAKRLRRNPTSSSTQA